MEKLVLVLILLLLHCEYAATLDPCPDTPDRYNPLCPHKECVSIADEMLEMMDNSTNPCDDFYQYACGGWISRQFLKTQSDKVTTFTSNLPLVEIRKKLSEEPQPADLPGLQKAKAFYASCIKFKMDAEKTDQEIEAALKKKAALRNSSNGTLDTTELATDYTVVDAVTDSFGKWPLTCKNCSADDFNLETALMKAVTLGVHPLFTLQADPESLTDSDERQGPSNLYVGIPALAFPIRLYESFSQYPSYRKVYAKKIVGDATDFAVDDRDAALQDAMEIVNAEIALAGIYNNLTTKGLRENLTLQALNTDCGQLLNWTRFVTELASCPQVGITDITPQEVVIVSDIGYLRQMCERFAQLPKRTQANYIIWRVIDSLNNVLMEDDRKLKNILDAATRKYKPALMSEMACVTYTIDVFQPVVHRLLYDAHVSNRTINTARDIMKLLTDKLELFVRNYREIDYHTRMQINEKVRAIQMELSFYDEVKNNSVLESFYTGITIDNSSFIKNVVQTRKDGFACNLQNIRTNKEVGPTALPHELVGHYYRRLNKLHITSIVLQPPFFSNIDYWPLTFAGFGSIMAHEIMRGLDTKGYRYNKDGVEGDWWSQETVQHLQQVYQCLAGEYSNYTYSPAGLSVNGTLNLDSNIAEILGIKMFEQAYLQYRADLGDNAIMRLPGVRLTHHQVLYVKYAQMRCTVEGAMSARASVTGEHSPDKIRVNGAIRYQSWFKNVFNCQSGSSMVPARWCHMF
ncbi:hypothetical protein BsWGS_17241 [Bradybaena similaris]